MSGLFPATDRRQPVLLLATIGVPTALAWCYLAYMAWIMPAMPAQAVPFWPTFIMWSVMMVAMMLPSAAPSIVAFAALERRRAGRGAVTPYLFAGGYLAAWIGYSWIATVGQQSLHALALLAPGMRLDSPALAGGLLVVAGVFQWTPLKDVCLRYCRSPLGLIAGGWQGGTPAALRLGLRQGLYCIGCCWALMLLMFVFGVMNVLWMALLTGLVAAEKVMGDSVRLVRLTGLVLVAAGAWFLVAS